MTYRQIAEQKIGRKLQPGEVVHHIDGDRTNNDPENLMVLPSRSAHGRIHMSKFVSNRRSVVAALINGEHAGSCTAQEAAWSMDVSVCSIRKWVREGRLTETTEPGQRGLTVSTSSVYDLREKMRSDADAREKTKQETLKNVAAYEALAAARRARDANPPKRGRRKTEHKAGVPA